MSVDIDNFLLPDGAAEAIKKQGYKAFDLSDGVQRFAGHDNGVAFRFFIESEKNPLKSKAGGYNHFNEEEMIEWHKDRFMHPTERVRLLPAELIAFEEQNPVSGNWDTNSPCIGGSFKEAYERFKHGRQGVGLSLARWDVLSEGEIATLASMGIFSVEQFAIMPRSKIVGRLPQVFVDAFEEAIRYLAGKDMREVASKQTDQIVALQHQIEEKDKQFEELRQQVKIMSQASAKPAAKRGRPPLNREAGEVIE